MKNLIWLKWKKLLLGHVKISVKTFSPEITIMSSSFIIFFYIFNIFHHMLEQEQSIIEVKWSASSLWNSDEMIIGKTHPPLSGGGY